MYHQNPGGMPYGGQRPPNSQGQQPNPYGYPGSSQQSPMGFASGVMPHSGYSPYQSPSTQYPTGRPSPSQYGHQSRRATPVQPAIGTTEDYKTVDMEIDPEDSDSDSGSHASSSRGQEKSHKPADRGREQSSHNAMRPRSPPSHRDGGARRSSYGEPKSSHRPSDSREHGRSYPSRKDESPARVEHLPSVSLPVNLDHIPTGFGVIRKLVGDNNQNITYIQKTTGVKIQLVGKGAGEVSGHLGVPSSAPLVMKLEHERPEKLKAAETLVTSLIRKVQAKFKHMPNPNAAASSRPVPVPAPEPPVSTLRPRSPPSYRNSGADRVESRSRNASSERDHNKAAPTIPGLGDLNVQKSDVGIPGIDSGRDLRRQTNYDSHLPGQGAGRDPFRADPFRQSAKSSSFDRPYTSELDKGARDIGAPPTSKPASALDSILKVVGLSGSNLPIPGLGSSKVPVASSEASPKSDSGSDSGLADFVAKIPGPFLPGLDESKKRSGIGLAGNIPGLDTAPVKPVVSDSDLKSPSFLSSSPRISRGDTSKTVPGVKNSSFYTSGFDVDDSELYGNDEPSKKPSASKLTPSVVKPPEPKPEPPNEDNKPNEYYCTYCHIQLTEQTYVSHCESSIHKLIKARVMQKKQDKPKGASPAQSKSSALPRVSSIQQDDKNLRTASPKSDHSQRQSNPPSSFRGPHTPPGQSPITDPDSETGPQSESQRHGFSRNSQERTWGPDRGGWGQRGRGTERNSRWDGNRFDRQSPNDRPPYDPQRGRGRGRGSHWGQFDAAASPRNSGNNSYTGYHNNSYNQWNSGQQNSAVLGGWGAFGGGPAGRNQSNQPGSFNARPNAPSYNPLPPPLFGGAIGRGPFMNVPRNAPPARSQNDFSRGPRFQGPGQRFSSPNMGSTAGGDGQHIPVSMSSQTAGPPSDTGQNIRAGNRTRVSRFDVPPSTDKTDAAASADATTEGKVATVVDNIQEIYDIGALHEMFRKNPKQAFILQITDHYRKRKLAKYEKAQSHNLSMPPLVDYCKKPHTQTFCKVCDCDVSDMDGHLLMLKHDQKYLELQIKLGLARFSEEFKDVPVLGMDTEGGKKFAVVGAEVYHGNTLKADKEGLAYQEVIVLISEISNNNCRLCKVECGDLEGFIKHVISDDHTKQCIQAVLEPGRDIVYMDVVWPTADAIDKVDDRWRDMICVTELPLAPKTAPKAPVNNNIHSCPVEECGSSQSFEAVHDLVNHWYMTHILKPIDISCPLCFTVIPDFKMVHSHLADKHQPVFKNMGGVKQYLVNCPIIAKSVQPHVDPKGVEVPARAKLQLDNISWRSRMNPLPNTKDNWKLVLSILLDWRNGKHPSKATFTPSSFAPWATPTKPVKSSQESLSEHGSHLSCPVDTCSNDPARNVFTSVKSLAKHWQDIHISDPMDFSCPVCSRTAGTFRKFVDHLFGTHPSTFAKITQVILYLQRCPVIYGHKTASHINPGTSEPPDEIKEELKNLAPNERAYYPLPDTPENRHIVQRSLQEWRQGKEISYHKMNKQPGPGLLGAKPVQPERSDRIRAACPVRECQFKNRVYDSSKLFAEHWGMAHLPQAINLRCPVCQEILVREQVLRRHMEKEHEEVFGGRDGVTDYVFSNPVIYTSMKKEIFSDPKGIPVPDSIKDHPVLTNRIHPVPDTMEHRRSVVQAILRWKQTRRSTFRAPSEEAPDKDAGKDVSEGAEESGTSAPDVADKDNSEKPLAESDAEKVESVASHPEVTADSLDASKTTSDTVPKSDETSKTTSEAGDVEKADTVSKLSAEVEEQPKPVTESSTENNEKAKKESDAVTENVEEQKTSPPEESTKEATKGMLACPIADCLKRGRRYHETVQLLGNHWERDHLPSACNVRCPVCKMYKTKETAFRQHLLNEHSDSFKEMDSVMEYLRKHPVIGSLKKPLYRPKGIEPPKSILPHIEEARGKYCLLSDSKDNLQVVAAGLREWRDRKKTGGTISVSRDRDRSVSVEKSRALSNREQVRSLEKPLEKKVIEKIPTKCPVKGCTDMSKGLADRAVHWSLVHTPIPMDIICPVCQEEIKRPSAIYRHLKKNHSDVFASAADVQTYLKLCPIVHGSIHPSFVDPGEVGPPVDIAKFVNMIAVSSLINTLSNIPDNQEIVKNVLRLWKTGKREFMWKEAISKRAPIPDEARDVESQSDNDEISAIVSDIRKNNDSVSQVMKQTESSANKSSKMKDVKNSSEHLKCSVLGCVKSSNDYRKSSELLEHWRDTHIEHPVFYACPICSDLKGSLKKLKKHLLSMHDDVFSKKDKASSYLDSCPVIYTTINAEHYIDPGNKKPPKLIQAQVKKLMANNRALPDTKENWQVVKSVLEKWKKSKGKNVGVLPQSSEKNHMCPVDFCDDVSTSVSNLALHWLVYHTPMPRDVICPLCNSREQNLSNIYTHLDNKHKDVFKKPKAVREYLASCPILYGSVHELYFNPRTTEIPSSIKKLVTAMSPNDIVHAYPDSPENQKIVRRVLKQWQAGNKNQSWQNEMSRTPATTSASPSHHSDTSAESSNESGRSRSPSSAHSRASRSRSRQGSRSRSRSVSRGHHRSKSASRSRSRVSHSRSRSRSRVSRSRSRSRSRVSRSRSRSRSRVSRSRSRSRSRVSRSRSRSRSHLSHSRSRSRSCPSHSRSRSRSRIQSRSRSRSLSQRRSRSQSRRRSRSQCQRRSRSASRAGSHPRSRACSPSGDGPPQSGSRPHSPVKEGRHSPGRSQPKSHHASKPPSNTDAPQIVSPVKQLDIPPGDSVTPAENEPFVHTQVVSLNDGTTSNQLTIEVSQEPLQVDTASNLDKDRSSQERQNLEPTIPPPQVIISPLQVDTTSNLDKDQSSQESQNLEPAIPPPQEIILPDSNNLLSSPESDHGEQPFTIDIAPEPGCSPSACVVSEPGEQDVSVVLNDSAGSIDQDFIIVINSGEDSSKIDVSFSLVCPVDHCNNHTEDNNFDSPAALAVHWLKVHMRMPSELYCPACGLLLRSTQILRDHLFTAHLDIFPSPNRVEIFLRECPVAFVEAPRAGPFIEPGNAETPADARPMLKKLLPQNFSQWPPNMLVDTSENLKAVRESLEKWQSGQRSITWKNMDSLLCPVESCRISGEGVFQKLANLAKHWIVEHDQTRTVVHCPVPGCSYEENYKRGKDLLKDHFQMHRTMFFSALDLHWCLSALPCVYDISVVPGSAALEPPDEIKGLIRDMSIPERGLQNTPENWVTVHKYLHRFLDQKFKHLCNVPDAKPKAPAKSKRPHPVKVKSEYGHKAEKVKPKTSTPKKAKMRPIYTSDDEEESDSDSEPPKKKKKDVSREVKKKPKKVKKSSESDSSFSKKRHKKIRMSLDSDSSFSNKKSKIKSAAFIDTDSSSDSS